MLGNLVKITIIVAKLNIKVYGEGSNQAVVWLAYCDASFP